MGRKLANPVAPLEANRCSFPYKSFDIDDTPSTNISQSEPQVQRNLQIRRKLGTHKSPNLGIPTYSEDEVVAELQDASQQAHASPHHFEKIAAHESFAPTEIHARRA